MIRFIDTGRPKGNVKFDPTSIQKYFDMGWVAQPKYNGNKIQAHIDNQNVVYFTRKGIREHKISDDITRQLLSIFNIGDIIEGEWLSKSNKFVVFDFIADSGIKLSNLPFTQRIKSFPAVATPNVFSAAYSTNIDLVTKWYYTERYEGVVFKAPSKGWSNTSMVRCKRPEMMDMSISNLRRGE